MSQSVDCPQFENAALWVQCARTGDSENHHITGTLKRGGWKEVDRVWLEPYTKWYEAKFGQKLRILLHLPFGKKLTSSQTKMHMYGALDAVRDDIEELTEDFESVVKKYTSAGHEVIVYIGSPHNTVELKQEKATKHRKDDVVRKMWLATRLALECECSIAFDNMASLGRSNHSECTYWYLNSLTKTYVESTLERHQRNARFWNEPQILMHRLFNNRHDDSQHQNIKEKYPRFDSDDWYQNDVLVLFTGGEVASAEKASALAARIKSFNGIPVFQTEGFGKIVKAFPIEGSNDD